MKKPKPLPDLAKWWPFDRMDAKVLEQLHRQQRKQNKPEPTPALL